MAVGGKDAKTQIVATSKRRTLALMVNTNALRSRFMDYLNAPLLIKANILMIFMQTGTKEK
jgi:hypothetical protein